MEDLCDKNGITADDIEDLLMIRRLAAQQNLSARQFIRKALEVNSRVTEEKRDGGRVLVEKRNKQLYELVIN